MTYEYENAMGYLQPPRRRVIEVYGTMPEAQEYVQEEFNLPYLPPVHALQPPMNPRTDPYRRVTYLPIESALGSDTTAPSFFERHKGWFITAGAIAGGYLLGKGLASLLGNRPLLANPPIKDVKFQEAGPTGHIPVRRGEAGIIDPAKLLPPGRYRRKQHFIDACLDINPNALEVKKLPATFEASLESATRQDAIKSTKAAYLRILAAGRNHFAPEDWVAGPKLYFKFRSFALIPVHINYDGKISGLPVLGTAIKLWMYLGMPSGNAMTAKSRSRLALLFGALQERRARVVHRYVVTMPRGKKVVAYSTLVKKLDKISNDHPGLIHPRLVWQLINIDHVYLLEQKDFLKLCRLLNKTDVQNQWRIRWLVERELRDHVEEYMNQEQAPPPLLPLSEHIEYGLSLPEKDFIMIYGRTSEGTDAWARLFGRVPKSDHLRNRLAEEVASIPMKPLLRLMRSKELTDYEKAEREKIREDRIFDLLDGVETRDEEINEGIAKIKEADKEIKGFQASIEALKAARKDEFSSIKNLEESEEQFLEQYGQAAYSKILNQRYKNYAEAYELIKKELENVRKAKKAKAKAKDQIAWARFMLRDNVAQLERIKKKGMPRSFHMREADENKINAAVGLSVVFGPNWQGWLKKMERRDIGLHDATYWLPTVRSKGLDAYLTKYWQAPIDKLSTISRGWNELEEEEQQLRPKDLLAVITSKTYSRAKVPDLAMEAARWGYSEKDYYSIERKWLKIQKELAELQRPSLLPQIDIRDGDYRMYRLEKDDPRSLFLGEHSDCCQSVDNVGGPCAWFGVSSPSSGFYVIEDRAGNIIAQSWAWRNDKYLVFDSIEGKSLWETGPRQNRIIKMYREAAEQIMMLDPSIQEVRAGSSQLDVDWPIAEEAVGTPKSYKQQYSDAEHMQFVIASRVNLQFGIPGVAKTLRSEQP